MINYIRLMNWFWEEVPHRQGYKADYGMTFLAIVDTINRNDWRETAADMDRMINKIKVSKRLYYESLNWLADGNIIVYTPGRNDYAPARFAISPAVQAEVQKCTATDTAVIPLLAPLLHHNNTSTGTSGVPSTAPIYNKQINLETLKPLNPKTLSVADATTCTEEVKTDEGSVSITVIESLSTTNPLPSSSPVARPPSSPRHPPNIPFETWWGTYDKKRDRSDCLAAWNKLTDDERQQALTHTGRYVEATPKQYRKDPIRYLKKKAWTDEIIERHESAQNNTPATNYRQRNGGRQDIAEFGKELDALIERKYGAGSR